MAPLTAKKNVTNREKEGKKRGKIGENREKEEKSGKKRPKLGRFFHFAPPDK